MICNYCLREFEPNHCNQKLCSPDCKKAAIRRSKDNYKKTDKGIATNSRWVNSDRRKTNERGYATQPHRRKLAVESSLRYLKSHPVAQEKKRVLDRKYGRSEAGRLVKKRAAAKYRLTERAREVRRITKAHRRGAIGSFTPEEWEIRLAEYGRKCAQCESTDHLEKDHIHPIALGGANTIDNIQPLCRSCNASKGARYVG